MEGGRLSWKGLIKQLLCAGLGQELTVLEGAIRSFGTFVHKAPGTVSGIGNTLVDATDKDDCRF